MSVQSPTLHSPTLAVARGLALIGFILVTGFSILLPAGWLGLRYAPVLLRTFYRVICRLAGLEIRVHGHPPAAAPALLVSNHVTYMDIPVLASVAEICFVAKAEVRDWPIIGSLAALHRPMYVERDPREIRHQAEELRRRLEAGDRLVIFPEGTSGDGNAIMPFKSSLFTVVSEAAGVDAPVAIQPVSIAYTRLDNLPMGRFLRPFCGWSGDTTFPAHLWRFLGIGRIGIDVYIHAPINRAATASRKALARHCESLVVESFSQSIAGKLFE